jgi:hypothetical protein
MSDSSSTAPPPPSFEVPRRFEGATLSTLAENIATGCPAPPEGWPPLLVLDFQRLNFILPAGVEAKLVRLCKQTPDNPSCKEYQLKAKGK